MFNAQHIISENTRFYIPEFYFLTSKVQFCRCTICFSNNQFTIFYSFKSFFFIPYYRLSFWEFWPFVVAYEGKRKGVSGMVKKINEQEFLSEAKAADVAVVDFNATWCGPCRMLAPVLEEIAAERSDIKVCKINVDEEKELARQNKVMGIPTLMVVRDGKIETRTTGGKNKDQVLDLL